MTKRIMMRLLKRSMTLLLLILLIALWLYPEFFGLRGGEIKTIAGDKVIVRDGDTLTIGTQDYRLHGIDAPEFSQTCRDSEARDWACGKLARAALMSLISGETLKCEERAHDKFGRIVATCADSTGRDIAKAMIVKGMAISFGGFTDGPYADEAIAAQAAKIGIWQGAFEQPQTYRARHPRLSAP
jgi:endonuclease YncB( thermonuclease family)